MDTLLAPVVLDEAQAIIWGADDPLSAEYAEALSLLALGIEAGFISYAGTLAEALASEGPLRDPAKAYVYYYLSYAQEGGLVEFHNLAEDSITYHGPPGDFRNEGMVAGLVEELGVQQLSALDAIASQLLANEI